MALFWFMCGFIALVLPAIIPRGYYFSVAYIFLFTSGALVWGFLADSGLISFGQSAFIGVGGYAAVLTAIAYGIPLPLALLLAGLLAASLALPLGFLSLRIRGPYFAMATFALFAIIIAVVYGFSSVTGGALGIYPLPSFPRIGSSSDLTFYFVSLLFMGATAVTIYLIARSKYGVAIRSIREDEVAAESTGVNVLRLRLGVLFVSEFFTGVLGGIYAFMLGAIYPSFVLDPFLSFQPMIISVFGGLYSFVGPFFGGLLLLSLQQFFLQPTWPTAYPLVYGGVLVFVMVFAPKGVITTVLDLVHRMTRALANSRT